MIKNSIDGGVDEYGMYNCDYIRCAFHAMFPGHLDGCGCELAIGYWDKYYHLLLEVVTAFILQNLNQKVQHLTKVLYGRAWEMVAFMHLNEDACCAELRLRQLLR